MLNMVNRDLSFYHKMFRRVGKISGRLFLIPNIENIGNSIEDYYFGLLTALNAGIKLVIIEPIQLKNSKFKKNVDFSYLRMVNDSKLKTIYQYEWLNIIVSLLYFIVNMFIGSENSQKVFIKFFKLNLNDHYLTPSVGQELIYNPLRFNKLTQEGVIETKKFYSRVLPKIGFNSEDEKINLNILRNFGIEDKDYFVAIHIRDSKFKQDFSNPRNCNPENYKLSINYILESGGFVIILGDSPYDFNIKHKNFIEYNKALFKNSLLDAFIISRSRFFISTASGLFDMSLLFDTPVLHTNNVSIYETRPLKPVDRLMYKKIFSKRMQRNLNIREFVNLRLDPDVVSEDENYSFEENSANELLLATREMMNPSSVQIDWTKQSMLKGMIKENNYVQKGRTSSSERPLDKLNYYRFLVRHEMSDCLIASDYLSSNW